MKEIRHKKAILAWALTRGLDGDWRTIKKILLRHHALRYDGPSRRVPVCCEEIYDTAIKALYIDNPT